MRRHGEASHSCLNALEQASMNERHGRQATHEWCGEVAGLTVGHSFTVMTRIKSRDTISFSRHIIQKNKKTYEEA